MAGFDLSNPQLQQALRDTFSDPSYGRAVAQAMPPANAGDLQNAWGQFDPSHWDAAMQAVPGGAGAWNFAKPFTSGFFAGVQDTQPAVWSWLKNYQPLNDRVSAWV